MQIPRSRLDVFIRKREGPKEKQIEQPNEEAVEEPSEEPSFAAELRKATFEAFVPLIVITAPIWGPFVYLMHRSEKAWNERLADYSNKELPDVVLYKGDSRHGFLFFMPPPGTPAFNEATLKLSWVNDDKAPSSVIHIPLKGLEFKGSPAEQN
jgi:hypothetical protein